ncbi:MAG: hypothetical protein VZS44_10360 [Bacilli bacterium]|nr:hypothetical protein [Bacilli bacterium]
MVVIKWRNKFSGEEGYVESISAKEQHFINTYDISQAKQYSSESIAKGQISNLAKYGEADNNDFEIINM